jgi:hypothetical protein
VPQPATTSILSSSSRYSTSADSADSGAGIEDSIPSDQASCGSETPSQSPLNSENTGHEDSSEPGPSSSKLSLNDDKSCHCGASDQIASLRNELSDSWRAWKDLVKALMKDGFTELGDALLEGLGLNRKYFHIDSDSDEGKVEDREKSHDIVNDAASDSNVESDKLSISVSEFEGKEQPPTSYL